MLVPIYEFVKVLSEKVANPPPKPVMVEEIEKLALANGVFYLSHGSKREPLDKSVVSSWHGSLHGMAKFEYLGHKLIANGIQPIDTTPSYIGVWFCYT